MEFLLLFFGVFVIAYIGLGFLGLGSSDNANTDFVSVKGFINEEGGILDCDPFGVGDNSMIDD